MKQLVSTIKLITVVTINIFIWSACTLGEKKPATYTLEEDDEENQVEKTEEVEESEKEDSENVELSLENLLNLLKYYDEPEHATRSGLLFIYKDVVQDGEVDCIEYVYGRDIEKGEKKEFGYQLKGTSAHCCYFKMNLDTSTIPSLYFGNKDDAKNFYERISESDHVEYEGKTYFIHKKDGEEALYIDIPYEEGQFETLYMIFPPEREQGFYHMRIDFWV